MSDEKVTRWAFRFEAYLSDGGMYSEEAGTLRGLDDALANAYEERFGYPVPPRCATCRWAKPNGMREGLTLLCVRFQEADALLDAYLPYVAPTFGCVQYEPKPPAPTGGA